MDAPRTIELSCTDPGALCALFVDGTLLGIGWGHAKAPIRTRQKVRWFVCSRRRNARFTLLDRRADTTRRLDEGPCARPLASNVLEVRRARRASGRAAPTAAGAPGGRRELRGAVARLPAHAAEWEPAAVPRGLLPPLEA